MTLPQKVKIVEVGPRDGLQNESQLVPAVVKIELIERLGQAGETKAVASMVVRPAWPGRSISSILTTAGTS